MGEFRAIDSRVDEIEEDDFILSSREGGRARYTRAAYLRLPSALHKAAAAAKAEPAASGLLSSFVPLFLLLFRHVCVPRPEEMR